MGCIHSGFGQDSSRHRPAWRRTVSALVASFAATLLVPAVALSIEPGDQFIPDPSNPLSLSATGVLSGGDVGTGTVIGSNLIGTTGYVAILTANHVAAKGETD